MLFAFQQGGLGRVRKPGGGGGDGAAHEYWRITGFQVSGPNMRISEIRMLDAALDLTQITYSSSSAPTLALANLFDNNLGTRCVWTAAVAEDAAFWIKADFKGPRAVDTIYLGGFDNSTRYPSQFDLQWSDDDSSWTTQASITGLTYPGNNTLSAAIDVDGGGSVTAHRYWRLRNFQVSGTNLEMSEVQFFNGATRLVNVYSSSDTPGIGTLARLFDNSLSTEGGWSNTVAEDPAFFIKIRFAGGQAEVDGLQFGGFTASNEYPTDVTLQYSDDDSSWTTYGSATGLTYPGNNTLSATINP